MPRNPGPPVQEARTIVDPGHAPIIYFEGAPVFGNIGPVMNITLAARRSLLTDGALAVDAVAVAFLRCHVGAAINLRDALDKAILAATQTGGEAN